MFLIYLNRESIFYWIFINILQNQCSLKLTLGDPALMYIMTLLIRNMELPTYLISNNDNILGHIIDKIYLSALFCCYIACDAERKI